MDLDTKGTVREARGEPYHDMRFKINGVDFSDCVQYSGRSETLRKVYGNNGMIALDGTEIVDIVGIKHDLTVNIVPMQSARLSELATALSSAYVELEYDSGLENQAVTRWMIPDMGSVALALHKIALNQDFYADSTLTFREK